MDKRGSCRRRASSPLLDRGILHDEEAPGLEIRAARGRDPGHENLADELIGHGIELEAAHRVHGLACSGLLGSEPARGPRAAYNEGPMKTLIRGGRILTLNREDAILAGEDVLIEDERITRAGGRLTERDGPFDRVIEASGRLVMPGFVNAHFHSYDRFHRGLWEGLPLEMWILWVSPLFQAPLSDRGATVRSQLGASEMLLAGTTAVVDNMHARSMTVESLGAEIQGYVDVGLRVGAAPMIWNRPFTRTMPYLDTIMPQAERDGL